MNSTATTLRSRNFQLSFWSFFFLWMSFDFFILFPLYILEKGGNSVDVGIQTAIFFFPSVLLRPFFGWLIDRFGRLKSIRAGTAVMILTSFAFLMFHGNYHEIRYAIAANLFFRGAGFAAFYTAFFTYVVDLTSQENRGRVIGLFGVSGLVAHGLAPWLGERVLKATSFDIFFLTCGSLSLLSFLISIFLTEAKPRAFPGGKGFQTVRSIAISRRNRVILPAAFVFGCIVASFNTFGAPYFKENGHAQVGYFFLCYGLTAGGVRILLGGLADSYSRWKLVSGLFLLQAAGVSLITRQPVDVYYLVAAALCGGAHGILFPTLTAIAIDAHPQEFRGIVTSIFTAAIELGFSLGAYLQGIAVHEKGYPFMFLVTGAMGILLATYVALSARYNKV